MKIAYVTSAFPLGAGEAFLAPELRELAMRGHELLIVPTRPRGGLAHSHAREFEALSLIHGLGSTEVVASALAYGVGNARTAGLGIASIAGEGRVGLRLKNAAVAAKGLWLGRELARRGIDHIHAYWASTPSTVAWIASRTSGIPFSFTAHRWDIGEANLLGRKALDAAFVRAVSEDGRSELRERLALFEREPVLIHVGVHVPAEGSAPEGSVGAPIRVLVPAALVEKKGHRFLLEAAGILRDTGVLVEFLLAGDGPLRAALERDVAARGLRNVRLLGQVEHEDLLGLCAAGRVDIVALPSVTLADGEREGIPVSLIEAMGHAIPVVASQSGGTSELVQAGRGILVPERDPAALADAIRRLSLDRSLRHRLGLAGRELVLREFEVARTVDRLERLFEERPAFPLVA